MNNFKPLRRKLGVVTLGATCLLAVGWLRSPYLQDTVSISLTGRSGFKLVSLSQRIIFVTLLFDSPEPLYMPSWEQERRNNTGWTMRLPTQSCGMKMEVFNIDPPNMGATFYFGAVSVDVKSRHCPYAAIVIPLTMLSAWLLISRPRPQVREQS